MANVTLKNIKKIYPNADTKKKKKKNVSEVQLGFDYGLVASLLNPITLIVLFAGIFQAWPIWLLVTIGVIGYGGWGICTYLDRKHPIQIK